MVCLEALRVQLPLTDISPAIHPQRFYAYWPFVTATRQLFFFSLRILDISIIDISVQIVTGFVNH